MTDREKVMWSLARCSCGVPDACSDCYYDNYPPRICVQHLTSDALALLKAQEPRVMTIDEVGTWVMIDRVDRAPIVVEVRNRFMAWVVGDEYYDLPDSNLSRELYGKEWRCCTSRPDEKRRAETPWE